MTASLPRLAAFSMALGFVAFAACGDDEAADGSSGTSGGAGGAGGAGPGGNGGLDITTTAVGGATTGTGASGPTCDGMLDGGDGEWAKGYAAGAIVRDIDVDAAGNSVVAGSFDGTLTIGGTTLTSTGTDVFVAKFGTDGQPVWAKSFGGTDTQAAQGVAFDSGGNVVLVGSFLDNINFGGGNLTQLGCCFEDAFIAKLDANGNHVWSSRYGDDDVDRVEGVAINALDEIYVTGQYKTALDFGDGGIIDTNGDYDLFVAKLSPAGTAIWSVNFGDGVEQDANVIALDNEGNVLIGGEISGAVTFGSSVLTVPGETSLFVAKLNRANGAAVWAASYGDGSSSIDAIDGDGQGNVYAGGTFRGTIDFGDGPIASNNGDDAFVLKFAPGGALTWSQTWGTNQPQTLAGLGATPSGNIYVTGSFAGDLNFGAGAISSAGASDVFVASLDSTDGCPSYNHAFGADGNQSGQALAVSDQGDAFVAGTFTGSIDFGAGLLTATGTDLFVAKLNP